MPDTEIGREPTQDARSSPPAGRPHGRAARTDLLWLAGLALALFVFLLWPLVARGIEWPLGPDTPVYLWWTRLAGVEGLSAVGGRPGVPALTLIAQGTLHRPLVETVAGLELALAIATGLASAALVHERIAAPTTASSAAARGRGPAWDRAAWLAAGALAGVFAVHLASGYLANIAFAVGFVAAAAALAIGSRRGAIAAALVLGGGGLAHPQFFLLGVAILVIAAIPSALRERASRPWRDTEWGRVLVAVLGAGTVVGAGLLAMLAGPAVPDVDSSKDGILRRAGRMDQLRSNYLGRFRLRWRRYTPYVSVPVALVGAPDATGFAGRFLWSWLGITLAGVSIGLVTAWFPPDRFVTFAFAVPILAGLGLVKIARLLAGRRWLAGIVVAALGVVMVTGAAMAWGQQTPFISESEIDHARAAGRLVDGSPAGTKFVFLVDTGDTSVTFVAAKAANILRAAVPPERIRDVSVLFAPMPADGSAPPQGSKAATYQQLLEDASAGRLAAPPDTVYVVLEPFSVFFAERARELGLSEVAGGVYSTWTGALGPEAAGPGAAVPLRPASPAAIGGSALAILALLWIAGFGWSRTTFGPGLGAAAAAPAFGAAGLTGVGIALERLGLPLTGSVGPTIVGVLVGGGGYLAAFLLERRVARQTAAEVGE